MYCKIEIVIVNARYKKDLYLCSSNDYTWIKDGFLDVTF